MKKRIRIKKEKQFSAKYYRTHCCECGLKNALKIQGIIRDEYLGDIHFRYPHPECPIHGINSISLLCNTAITDAKRKLLTKLLLKKFNPNEHEYLSLEETSKLLKKPQEKLKTQHKKVSNFIYGLKYRGNLIFLKESVDKYLSNRHNGRIKLVDYRTQEDDWIKRVLLHDNYDVDVEFYDGTCRRTNVLEYIEKDDYLKVALLDINKFLNPRYVANWGIYYGDDMEIDNLYLYNGKHIPSIEGGIKRRDW